MLRECYGDVYFPVNLAPLSARSVVKHIKCVNFRIDSEITWKLVDLCHLKKYGTKQTLIEERMEEREAPSRTSLSRRPPAFLCPPRRFWPPAPCWSHLY